MPGFKPLIDERDAARARAATLLAENERLRASLAEIIACPEGVSKKWPEIEGIVRAAMARADALTGEEP